jgi:hypothetical protein
MKIIFTTLSFLLIGLSGYSQITINPSPVFAECPGVALIYQADNSVTNSCIFDWTVTNGSIQGGIQNGNVSTYSGGNLVTITWFDVTQNGQINIQTRNCSPSGGNTSGSGTTFTYAILSINGVNPGTVSGASAVTVNVTSNQSYSIPQINFPNIGSGDVNPKQVNGYEWEIPSGWTVVSGGNTKSVTVKPDNCSGGNIRVRGKNTACTGNTFYSNWSTVKTVTRSLPNPGAISGPDAVNCTDTSVKTYSIGAVTGATSYTWTYPSGWEVQGSSTTNSITLVPNGLNGGVVTIKANGCSIQSGPSSKNITLNLTDINNPPAISGVSPVCYSGSTFTLTNMPANSTVVWSQSSNLTTVSGQGTTNYSVRANSTSTMGAGWVEALITTACGNPPPLRYNIWVGRPPADINTLIWTGTRGVNPVSTNPGVTYVFRVDQVPNTSSYTWVLPSGFSVYGGSNTTTGTTIYITTSTTPGNYTLHCQANNACGSSWTNSLTINNGTGGGGNDCPPGVSPPCKPGGPIPLRVYPNPASSSLMIEEDLIDAEGIFEQSNDSFEIVEFRIQLLDKSGMLMRSGQSQNGKLEINTKDLPNGFYILRIMTPSGIEHRQINIKH